MKKYQIAIFKLAAGFFIGMNSWGLRASYFLSHNDSYGAYHADPPVMAEVVFYVCWAFAILFTIFAIIDFLPASDEAATPDELLGA